MYEIFNASEKKYNNIWRVMQYCFIRKAITRNTSNEIRSVAYLTSNIIYRLYQYSVYTISREIEYT